jgi:hypothetical protein
VCSYAALPHIRALYIDLVHSNAQDIIFFVVCIVCAGMPKFGTRMSTGLPDNTANWHLRVIGLTRGNVTLAANNVKVTIGLCKPGRCTVNPAKLFCRAGV